MLMMIVVALIMPATEVAAGAPAPARCCCVCLQRQAAAWRLVDLACLVDKRAVQQQLLLLLLLRRKAQAGRHCRPPADAVAGPAQQLKLRVWPLAPPVAALVQE